MSKKRKHQNRDLAAAKTAVKKGIEKAPKIAADRNASGTSADLAFGKGNFTVMLIGIGVIILGFIIMTMDKEEFGFGFLGLTLGPIILFCGFMIEIYAILKKKG